MSEISGPNLTIIALCGTVSLSYLLYHTYQFDRCRCLFPRRKDWFRGLLTWMLLISNMCWIVWASGWAHVKYSLGFVRLGSMGARSWPSALFPSKFVAYNAPLTTLFAVCYGLQASLNAEEGLYWYHLIRSVRKPQSAVPFLSSRFFYAWIVISVILGAVQLSVPWIGHKGDLRFQLVKELLTGGILEFIVLVASTVVILKFPTFLKDIERAGAGPDVRARLHFYHELNKLRTFCRFLFTIPLLILGIDGLTSNTINYNALATDFLASLSTASLSAVMIISIIVYLPRSASSAKQLKVMVAQKPHATQQALLTMLREGGWNEVDDDLTGADGRAGVEEAPFALSEARPTSWNTGGEEKWAGRSQGGDLPQVLNNFTSPFAVDTEPVPSRPVEVHIYVERDVHRD